MQLLVLKTRFPSFIYVAVIKYPDKMNLGEKEGDFFFIIPGYSRSLWKCQS